MFDNAFRDRIAARSAQTLYSALDDWRDSDGGWFTGTVASVDARLAKLDSLIHRFRQSGPLGYGILAELGGERESLTELRHSMLNGHQDRVAAAPTVVYPEAAHEINMVAARDFVRRNIEVAHVPTEMRERARFHAERVEPKADANLFAETCVRVAATVPRAPVQRVAATVEDFDDHHLFL